MPHEVDEPQGPHRDTPCGLMPIFRRGHLQLPMGETVLPCPFAIEYRQQLTTQELRRLPATSTIVELT